MSDQRIRELEREFNEGGDPSVGGQLLRMREQAGLLPPRAIELLQLLQAPAALALSPTPGARPPQTWPGLAELMSGIRTFGPEPSARATLAIQRRLLSLFVAHAQGLAQGRSQDEAELLSKELRACLNHGSTVLGEVRAWILASSFSQPPALSVAGHRPRVTAHFSRLRDPGQGQGLDLLLVYFFALEEFDQRTAPSIVPRTSAWERYLQGLRFSDPSPWRAGVVRDLVHALNADLGPWAAGSADPLRTSQGLDLDQVLIASPCEVSWDTMRGNDRVRSCGECSRTVFDLSALSRDEARALLGREGDRICVRLFRRADGRVQTRDCIPGLLSELIDVSRGVTESGSLEAPPVEAVGSLMANPRPGPGSFGLGFSAGQPPQGLDGTTP